MERKTVATLLVTALIMLSGCSGVLPGNDGPTPTNDGDYPAGVTPDGVSNYTTLVDNHLNAIQGTSTSVDISVTTNGETRESSLQYNPYSGDGFAYATQHEVRNGERAQYYDSKTLNKTYVMTVSGNDTVYRTQEPQNKSSVKELLSQQTLIGDFSPFFEFEVSTTDGGKTQLTSTGVADKDKLAQRVGFQSIESASMEMTVNDDGLVERVVVSASSANNSVSYKATFSQGISVTEPDWLTEAKNKALNLEVSTGGDNSYLVINYKQGMTISEDYSLFVGASNLNEINLDQPLEAGNTYYIYFESGSPKLVNEPPTNSTLSSGSYTVAVLSQDGSLIFDKQVVVESNSDE